MLYRLSILKQKKPKKNPKKKQGARNTKCRFCGDRDETIDHIS